MTDTQHPGHDRRGHGRDPGKDRLVLPEWMREQAARAAAEHATMTADGIAVAASPDDPVVVAERIGHLRAEHGPSAAEETLTRAEAVQRLTEHGFDPDSAQAMVAQYLHEASRAVGAPVYQWGLDQTDLDAITAGHPDIGMAEAEQHEQRREQLVRWHHDDHPEHDAGDGHTHSATDADAADDQVWVRDDAPGLP